MSTETEPLTICGIPLEHSSGFVWVATVCGFHVRFHADRDGTSVAIARSTPSGPPLHEERGETHELVAEAMGRWIEKKTGHTATPSTRRNAMKLTERPIAELRDHPLNPRIRSSESVAEMKASIERHGLLQPLVIKPDGTVLLGHRRRWALEELGRETAPCYVTDGESEAKSIELLIIGNEHVERPDPLRESEAVAQLLAQPGWNVKTVADALGRSMRWVARRANLRNLGPELQKLALPGKPLGDWRVEWLEQLAILAKDAQVAFAKRYAGPSYNWPKVHNQADLDSILADEFHVLGKAPFDIHDQELVPRAGACVVPEGKTGASCKKTTIARPGLFDDDPVGGDVKVARCCDSPCWISKVKAHVQAAIAKAKESHGKDLVVVEPSAVSGSARDAIKGLNTVAQWQVEKCKGTATGAKPAIQLNDDGSVTSTFVRSSGAGGGVSSNASSTKSSKAAGEDKRSAAQKLKDSKEGIANRRIAHVVDAVKAWLEDEENEKTTPSWKDTRELLVRFNTEPSYKYDDSNAKKDLDEIAEIAADDLRLARDLWPRLRADIGERLKRWGGAGERLKTQYALALWVAPKLGLEPKHLDGDAVVDIPDPKWWPDEARTPDPFRAERHAAMMSGKQPAPAKGARTPPRPKAAAAKPTASKKKARK